MNMSLDGFKKRNFYVEGLIYFIKKFECFLEGWSWEKEEEKDKF